MNRIHPITATVRGYSTPRVRDNEYFKSYRTQIATSYIAASAGCQSSTVHSSVGDEIQSDSSDSESILTFNSKEVNQYHTIGAYADKFTNAYYIQESKPFLETSMISGKNISNNEGRKHCKKSKVCIFTDAAVSVDITLDKKYTNNKPVNTVVVCSTNYGNDTDCIVNPTFDKQLAVKKESGKKKQLKKRHKKNKIGIYPDKVVSGQVICDEGMTGDKNVKAESIKKSDCRSPVVKVGTAKDTKDTEKGYNSNDTELIMKQACTKNRHKKREDGINGINNDKQCDGKITKEKVATMGKKGNTDYADLRKGKKRTRKTTSVLQMTPVEELSGTEVYCEEGDDTVWIIRPAFTKDKINGKTSTKYVRSDTDEVGLSKTEKPSRNSIDVSQEIPGKETLSTREVKMDTDKDDISGGKQSSRKHRNVHLQPKVPVEDLLDTAVYCEEGDKSLWIIRPAFAKDETNGKVPSKEVNMDSDSIDITTSSEITTKLIQKKPVKEQVWTKQMKMDYKVVDITNRDTDTIKINMHKNSSKKTNSMSLVDKKESTKEAKKDTDIDGINRKNTSLSQKKPVEELADTEVYCGEGDDSVWIIRPAFTKDKTNEKVPTKEMKMDNDVIDVDEINMNKNSCEKYTNVSQKIQVEDLPGTQVYCEEEDDSVWIIRTAFTKAQKQQEKNDITEKDISIFGGINYEKYTERSCCGEKVENYDKDQANEVLSSKVDTDIFEYPQKMLSKYKEFDRSTQLKNEKSSKHGIFSCKSLTSKPVSEVDGPETLTTEIKKLSAWKRFCMAARKLFKIKRRSNKIHAA